MRERWTVQVTLLNCARKNDYDNTFYVYFTTHKQFFKLRRGYWRTLTESAPNTPRAGPKALERFGKAVGWGARVLNWGKVGSEKAIFVRKLVQEEKKLGTLEKTAVQKVKCNHNVHIFFIK